jgi:hypothetical protein
MHARTSGGKYMELTSNFERATASTEIRPATGSDASMRMTGRPRMRQRPPRAPSSSSPSRSTRKAMSSRVATVSNSDSRRVGTTQKAYHRVASTFGLAARGYSEGESAHPAPMG